jgi:hypothetical protein
MNTTQAQMAHYGATRFLMDKVDSISRQISSLVSIAEEPIQTQMSYLQPILSTFYTLESNLVSQSTLYGLKAGSYRSTLQSQTEQIYSLQAKFDDLVSNISSLLPQSS